MWLPIALLAYILFAGATIVDKYLLTRPIPDPRVYAVYTGMLGLFAFAMAPFGFQIPQGPILVLGIFSGVLFMVALLLFFVGLQSGEVSRVGVAIGGLVPFFTLFFVYIGTGELPGTSHLIAFALLVLGSFIILFDRIEGIFYNTKILGLIFASSFLFGLYFTITKFLFSTEPFISAFLWIKVGGALFALFLLFSPTVRRTLFAHKKLFSERVGEVLAAKNMAGGVATILQHLAISTANFSEVALVNALQGAQFVLVFFIPIFLAKKFPAILGKMREEVTIAKAIGAGCIVLGVIILAVT